MENSKYAGSMARAPNQPKLRHNREINAKKLMRQRMAFGDLDRDLKENNRMGAWSQKAARSASRG